MKRFVDNDIAMGVTAGLATLLVVALTGAGATATYLIAAAFLAIIMVIHERPPRIQRWRERRGSKR